MSKGSPRAEDSGRMQIAAAIVTALLWRRIVIALPSREPTARNRHWFSILGWDGSARGQRPSLFGRGGTPDAHKARHCFSRDDGRRLYLLDHRLRGFLGDKPASVSRLGSASYASKRSAVRTVALIGSRLAPTWFHKAAPARLGPFLLSTWVPRSFTYLPTRCDPRLPHSCFPARSAP
jgi:hypothetical protein